MELEAAYEWLRFDDKTVKELEIDIAKARYEELTKAAAWELETAKAEKLEKQIAHCRLIAPADGVLLYPADPAPVRSLTPRSLTNFAVERQ